MNEYKVSVIIPIYNQEKYLDRAINSVINQSIGFENIELLLVDDCSIDNTKEIINNYINMYENIKGLFLEKNSGGASKPRNIGIKNSTSKYLMFLDPDDYYLEDTIKVLFNEIESDSDLDHVRANLLMLLNNTFYKKNYIKNT